jgi:hypothetical protein
MKAVHNNRLSGHPGIVRKMDKLKMYVWWPGMQADIIQYVSTCVICQRVKRATHEKAPPMSVRLATRPWQQIGIDVTGPLPVTSRNNEYIVDVVCHFTRYVEGWAVPEINMVTIAKAVIDNIICRYGLFEIMVSDRGSVFVGTLAAHIYKALKIKRVKTTANHPQSNGIIERFHATLKTTLKLWSLEVGDEWDVLLQFAIFAYNTAFHVTLQEVPHFLNHGYDARLPIDEVLQNDGDSYADVHQYAAELVDKLQHVHTRVKQILEEVNIERDENELLAKMLKLAVGDEVWMFDPTTATGESKMKVRWKGPYTILQKISSVVYIINKDGHPYTVNIDRLKKTKVDNNNNNNNNDKKDRDILQLEQINDELNSMKQMQLTLIEKKKLTELQKEQLSEKIKAASAVAKQVATADAEEEEKYGGEDEVSELSAAITMYLHSGEVNWNS